MRHCDLDTSAAQLRSALEDLQRAWQVTCESWDDLVSRKFAEQHLDPLAPTSQMALDAAGRMRELVKQIQRECEE